MEGLFFKKSPPALKNISPLFKQEPTATGGQSLSVVVGFIVCGEIQQRYKYEI